jgi:ribonuclease E
MANKMLIDATHPEETRVVVLRGNRVEEFDFESAQRKQLRGNIYLAKVTRVEPSLQAAFVDYGGNRHGFLAFSEIHPDYYQIPVADRQALIDEEGRAQRAADDEDDRRSRRNRGRHRASARRDEDVVQGGEPAEPVGSESPAAGGDHAEVPAQELGIEDEAAVEAEDTEGPTTLPGAPFIAEGHESPAEEALSIASEVATSANEFPDAAGLPALFETETRQADVSSDLPAVDEAPNVQEDVHDAGEAAAELATDLAEEVIEAPQTAPNGDHADGDGDDDEAAEEIVESVGGADALEEVPDRAPRYRRQSKRSSNAGK